MPWFSNDFNVGIMYMFNPLHHTDESWFQLRVAITLEFEVLWVELIPLGSYFLNLYSFSLVSYLWLYWSLFQDGSQPGMILLPRGCLAISGDIFGCHTGRYYWLLGRNRGFCWNPMMHTQNSTTAENYIAQSVSSCATVIRYN